MNYLKRQTPVFPDLFLECGVKMVQQKKDEQLGMNASTAATKLRKAIMYSMAEKLNLLSCYRCGKKIETIEEFSIEHKIDWLNSDNPKDFFFDLNNISFSHLKCNTNHTSYRFPKMVSLQCDNCGKSFERLPSQDRKKKKAGIKNVFCSKSCRSNFYYKQNGYKIGN